MQPFVRATPHNNHRIELNVLGLLGIPDMSCHDVGKIGNSGEGGEIQSLPGRKLLGLLEEVSCAYVRCECSLA